MENKLLNIFEHMLGFNPVDWFVPIDTINLDKVFTTTKHQIVANSFTIDSSDNVLFEEADDTILSFYWYVFDTHPEILAEWKEKYDFKQIYLYDENRIFKILPYDLDTNQRLSREEFIKEYGN